MKSFQLSVTGKSICTGTCKLLGGLSHPRKSVSNSFNWAINLQLRHILLGPVVQSVISLTSSLRVISLTILADSIYNILIFFAKTMRVAFAL